MVLNEISLIFFVNWGDVCLFPFLWEVALADTVFINDEKRDTNCVVAYLQDARCDAIVAVSFVNVKFSDVVNDIRWREIDLVY